MLIIRTLLLTSLISLTIACQPHHSDATKQVPHAATGAYDAAISSDGRYSIVSSVEHGVAVWDNQVNGLKFQWYLSEDEQNMVVALDISADSYAAVTATREEFAVWDLESGENLGFYKINQSHIRDIAISNKGRYVMYGRADGVAVHIDLTTGRRIEFLGHQEKINAVALSPNGFYALTGGNDYSAYLWDTRTGQVVYRFNHASRVTQVALDPQARFAFTAGSKKQASIWDLTTGAQHSNLQYIARQKIFSAVRFSDDAKWLATGSPSRELAMWNIDTGERVLDYQVAARANSQPKSAVVFAVAFAENNQLITESSSGLSEYFEIKRKQ
ncbi:WD40 repeat domain-containing protein [Pseudoalteromonas sp. SSDWG2]|uniref:WD40 repeat domain-containing protein n=1 Tax=Pseudoalteromonas sp. SSDWG2 TaxID=3139391 RepID=UPI003BACAB84